MVWTMEKTPAYGLWKAAGTRPDGGLVEALGTTPERARQFARTRAQDWVRCDGCSRVNVRPAEAKVSRRAFRGLALCPDCQRSTCGGGPDLDQEREAVLGL